MKFPSLKIWGIFLALSFLGSAAAWAQPGNVAVGGGIRCTNAGYCSVFSSSLPDVYGGPADVTNRAIGWYQGAAVPFDEWCIVNSTAPYYDIFIPTATFAEFQSFITTATDPNPLVSIPGVTVGPCCDTARCALHNGNCAACAAEGLVGLGNCCDWTCATPNALTNINGNACCQISYVPPGPLDPGLLRGGQCADTCTGDNNCQAWENNSNCCWDCNSYPDGFCCAADAEDISSACQDCPGGFACPNTVCCPGAGEDRTNCADCAVCNDDYCTAPPETSLNCCRDCAVGPAFCGNGQCCPFHENTVNCCRDCGCGPGFTCYNPGDLLCHDDCDTLPYVHEPGPHQCTISVVSTHAQSPSGSCAITGTCSAQCSDGNIINWTNNCCTNWGNAGCGAGGCGATFMYQTRTCSSISTSPLTQCTVDNSCCTGWASQGCGGGPCGATQRRETRVCGSNTETQCITDGACCTNWSNAGCGPNGGCAQIQMNQTRTCGASPQSQCVNSGSCCEPGFDVGCGAGGCPGNTEQRCQNCGGSTSCSCFTDSACCTSWTSVGCDSGCSDQQRRENRMCGSNSESQCFDDAGCCTNWGSVGCGGGPCWQGQRRDERWCGNSGSPETTCTQDNGCSWQGNWGPFAVIEHGSWKTDGTSLTTAPCCYQNYTITWYTSGHRHGGSHFECRGSHGGVGINGVGDGGALGPEYGGQHWARHDFPCSGSGTGGFNGGWVWITVQDVESFFYWTIRAW